MSGSRRVSETLPPVMQIMEELASGKDFIKLSQGVPYLKPPAKLIMDAISQSEDVHRYGPDGGDIDFKEALSKKLEKKNSITASPDKGIIITAGANMGFFLAVASLCDAGDEVVLIDPFYFNHKMSLDVLGVNSVHVGAKEGYLPDPQHIEDAVTPRTRAIVIVSPNNPTGVIYPEELVRKIAVVCAKRGVALITDETYEDFVYDGAHFSPGSIEDPDLDVISLFSMSKSYGISGFRIGYAVFPESLFDNMLKVQDTTIICAPRPSQRAALALLERFDVKANDFMFGMGRNRDLMNGWLADVSERLVAPKTIGAFYSFPFVKATDDEMDSFELAKRVLDEAKVLVVPGAPFGAVGAPAFRISFGNVKPALFEEALNRIRNSLDKILG